MRKVIIPKTVKIGGHEYEVKFPHRFTERDQVVGLHDCLGRKLFISDVDLQGNKRPFSDLLRTWFHEVLHGIDKVYCGYQLTKTENNGEEGFNVLESLAEGLTQVFIDNEWPYEKV